MLCYFPSEKYTESGPPLQMFVSGVGPLTLKHPRSVQMHETGVGPDMSRLVHFRSVAAVPAREAFPSDYQERLPTEVCMSEHACWHTCCV